MSLAWYAFYGRLLHIPLAERDCMPFGEMGDMIACYQIIHGANQKEAFDDEEAIPDIL